MATMNRNSIARRRSDLTKRWLAFSLLTLLFAPLCLADSLTVTFRYDDPGMQKIRTFVPGEFNGWGPNVAGVIAIGAPSQMTFNAGAGAWIKPIRLQVGTTYAYKYHFHLDPAGTTWQWIADPLNPLVDNSGYGNSLVTITDPMVFEPLITRTTAGHLQEIKASIFGTSRITSVKLFVNGDSTDVTTAYDTSTGIVHYVYPQSVVVTSVKIVGRDLLGHAASYQESFGPPGAQLPWENEIVYQIFPRSFYDSNGDANGDFAGIEQKLDYLQELGVTSIWINPVYRSRAYHNYFAESFDTVDSEFGTNAGFVHLLRAMHERGMKLILDMESQYITDQHYWYKLALNNPASPYSPYIVFNGPNNTNPNLVLTLASYDGLSIPVYSVNLMSAASRSYQKRMFAHYVDPNGDGLFDDGVDGFRIDHIMDDLDYQHQNTNLYAGFWKPLFDTLRSINPNIFFTGEQADWGSYGSPALVSADADAMFGIPQMFALRSFDKNSILSAIDQTLAATPYGKYQFTIIENHDVDRFASAVGGTIGRMKTGAALLLTLKGVPCLYYGQELGMRGTKGNWGSDGNDIPNREAFEWYATVAGTGMATWYANSGPWWTNTNLHNNDGISLQEEYNDTTSLWNYYRKLIALRRNHVALSQGAYTPLPNNSSTVVSYLRKYTGGSWESIVVIANLSDVSNMVPVNLSALREPLMVTQGITDLLGSRTFVPLTNSNAASYPVLLAGNEVAILKIATAAIFLEVTPKWNLISLPLAVGDGRKSTLFPDVGSNAFTFSGGEYRTRDTLTAGIGYWLKFDSAKTYSISGGQRTLDSINVVAGWNMIGALTDPIAVSSVGSVPGGLVTSDFFGYNGSYTIADSLMPNRGYWVKVSGAGKLVLSSVSAPPAGSRIRIMPDGEFPPAPPADPASGPLEILPAVFVLEQNYPNPFNPSTQIRYGLPVRSMVSIRVYNALGQEIAELLSGEQEAGHHVVEWRPAVASGIYFCRIDAVDLSNPARSFTQVRKMVLMK